MLPSLEAEEKCVGELEDFEESYYDGDERLLEDRLERDFLEKRNIFSN